MFHLWCKCPVNSKQSTSSYCTPYAAIVLSVTLNTIYFLPLKKKSQGISHHFLRIPFLHCLWLKKEKKKTEKIQVMYKTYSHVKVLSSATKLGTWKLFVEGLFNYFFFLFFMYFLTH